MEWLWILIGILLCIAGVIGSVLPILPGPPLNYIAILVIHFSGTHQFSERFLTGWFIITLLVVILDYMIPVWGARLSGGSRRGMWGATIGLLLGIVFFPPIGMIIGSFAGAIIGELIEGKPMEIALKAGTGTFIGFLAGTVAKLVVSVILTILFVQAII